MSNNQIECCSEKEPVTVTSTGDVTRFSGYPRGEHLRASTNSKGCWDSWIISLSLVSEKIYLTWGDACGREITGMSAPYLGLLPRSGGDSGFVVDLYRQGQAEDLKLTVSMDELNRALQRLQRD